MKNNIELRAALNVVLARLDSEPKTAGEWCAILGQLEGCTRYAKKTMELWEKLEDLKKEDL